MSLEARYGEINPIVDKNQPIPSAWLYPHYTDDRFTETRTEGRTIFLARGAITVSDYYGEHIEGANYNYSDRIQQSFDWDLVERATEQAEEEVGNKDTAAYFEAKLRLIYEEPTTELLHIIAGVNRGNGFPYQIFGTTDGSRVAR